jgi:hypothetical protein
MQALSVSPDVILLLSCSILLCRCLLSYRRQFSAFLPVGGLLLCWMLNNSGGGDHGGLVKTPTHPKLRLFGLQLSFFFSSITVVSFGWACPVLEIVSPRLYFFPLLNE